MPDEPLWFAPSELLALLLHTELDIVNRLLAENQDLPKLFDAPEATPSQRSICFALLAHRRLVEMIDELFVRRYEQSPPLNELESNALKQTNDLVTYDAPAWIVEIDKVVELLPSRMLEALPEPLRKEGFYRNNPAEDDAVRSAAETFSTVEQIKALTQGVLDQQLRRLEARWATNVPPIVQVQGQLPSKQKRLRKRDAQRIKRDELIAEISVANKTPTEFLQIMDERKVPPQPTWKNWPGSWVQAYKRPDLRKLIHQDKSRAVSRVLTRRGR